METPARTLISTRDSVCAAFREDKVNEIPQPARPLTLVDALFIPPFACCLSVVSHSDCTILCSMGVNPTSPSHKKHPHFYSPGLFPENSADLVLVCFYYCTLCCILTIQAPFKNQS